MKRRNKSPIRAAPVVLSTAGVFLFFCHSKLDLESSRKKL